MSSELITALVSIVLAIIGLAALATVLSPKAYTSKVIGAASQGLAVDIGAATAPVTGTSGIGAYGGLTLGSGIG